MHQKIDDIADHVYDNAWDEGVKAYNDGETNNPYPPCDLHNNSWEDARKYLGWNDGFFHAPHFEKGVE
tara:strand:+ start:87898 stop:88101 length:204 start_codon:yes stop_codon:yes gene_type:complete